ncbi:hypothetical protein ES703_99698 [subsurface metagenome]
MGVLYQNIEEEQEAINCYKKALEIDSEDVDSIFNTGISYANLKEFQKAIKCFENILKIDPENQDALEMIKNLKNNYS